MVWNLNLTTKGYYYCFLLWGQLLLLVMFCMECFVFFSLFLK